MFNLDQIEEISGTSRVNSNLQTLDTETCAKLLIAESIQDLTRPIRRLSQNNRIAIQQQFNRSISQMIAKADNSTNEALTELMKQAAMRVQAAYQKGEEESIQEATQRLERVINFLSDLASNVARNSFYRNEECLNMETPAADGKVGAGIDGATGAFETKSKYSGWRAVVVESTTMVDAADEAIDGLLSAIKALLPLATSYLQSLLTNEAGKVHVQLGYRMSPDGSEEAERFYTRADVWTDIEQNRRKVVEPMSAAEAVAAFKL